MPDSLGRRRLRDRRLGRSSRLAVDDRLSVARSDVLAAGRRGHDAAFRFVVRRKLLAGRRRARMGDGLVGALRPGVCLRKENYTLCQYD